MSNTRIDHSQNRRPARRIPYLAQGIAAVILAALIFAPGIRPAHADDNRFDIMRLITTQWIKPFMYISLDTSGSMHMTFDQSYNNDQRWYFDDGGSADGYISLKDDWTHDNRGIGQGFWLRVGLRRIINEPPTSWTFDGYTSNRGWVDNDFPDNIYSPGSEPALSRGQLIEITNYPIDGVNGIYMVSEDSLNSGHNTGWRYTKFIKMDVDGSFGNSTYTFPLLDTGNGDVQDFTFNRVTMTTVSGDLVASGDSDNSRMNDGARELLYIDEDHNVTAGDIVEVTGFSNSINNGTFLIRRYVSNGSGYDRFRVSKMDSLGNFPDSEFQFQGGDDYGGTAEFMWLDFDPMTQWYFVPATRIAVAKNVWGNAITVYEPSAIPEGDDLDGKEYYLFSGAGPTNGAWLEWEDSGDNGYGARWHNWSSASGAAPAGDSAYTTTQLPSSMVRRFGDVAHLGLIEYSGVCPRGYFTPRVDLDPDSPTSVVTPIENRFKTRAAGGIIPGGSTPTKKAISSGGNELVQAYNNDPQNTCGRTYGVLLMTDGISNNCNPGDNAWTNCSDDFADYPAGDADDLWNMTVSGVDLEIRTWALGISEEVGRCELNFTAYKGRTDASSPNGDAGFSIDDDPYLTDGNTDVYDTAHGDYAFFASSVDELRQALLDIISSMGVGDYATSSPAVSNSSVATSGVIGLLGSSEYPSWEGHLRAFEIDFNSATTDFFMWDAADELADSTSPNNGFTRRIYTWDPTNSNAIVSIAAGTAAAIDTVCSSCGITDEVVDFILGNDGSLTGTMRPYQFGAVLNSTPAVIGSPIRFDQNQLEEHSSFEATYGSRHTLVWIGTSDGSIAGFDIKDGTEILRLIPPNLLTKQVSLYNNFASNPAKNPLGQSGLPVDHIYGVANSVRFGDVWDSTLSEYRTVMYIAEGPGGNGVHAIDVTHPYPGRTIGSDTYPADPNYGYGILAAPPFKVLWSKTADGAAGTTQMVGLGEETWSIPALGATATDEWVVQVAAGYNENPGNASNPEVYYLDPITGGPFENNLANSTVSLTNDNAPYVPNNSFADAVVWQDDSNVFKGDNLVNESVQADLNGHLWSITESSGQMVKSALVTFSAGDPLYYAPAVAGYPNQPVAYSMYAFSTGSFYAINEDISGADIGTTGNFIPKIYIAAKDLSTGSVSSQGIALNTLPKPSPLSGTLGTKTQIIAPPMIFTPDSDSSSTPFALYLVYDPFGADCVGISYVVSVPFDPSNLSTLGSNVSVYAAGEGMAGGFALAGSKVVVSQSGVGEDEDAHLVIVPDLIIVPGGASDDVSWWIELQ